MPKMYGIIIFIQSFDFKKGGFSSWWLLMIVPESFLKRWSKGNPKICQGIDEGEIKEVEW